MRVRAATTLVVVVVALESVSAIVVFPAAITGLPLPVFIGGLPIVVAGITISALGVSVPVSHHSLATRRQFYIIVNMLF